jgi:hypothetical protein
VYSSLFSSSSYYFSLFFLAMILYAIMMCYDCLLFIIAVLPACEMWMKAKFLKKIAHVFSLLLTDSTSTTVFLVSTIKGELVRYIVPFSPPFQRAFKVYRRLKIGFKLSNSTRYNSILHNIQVKHLC